MVTPAHGRLACPDCSRMIKPRRNTLSHHKCPHGTWCDGRCPHCPPKNPRGALVTLRYDQVRIGDQVRDTDPDAPTPWAKVTATLVNDITGTARLFTERGWCVEGKFVEEDGAVRSAITVLRRPG